MNVGGKRLYVGSKQLNRPRECFMPLGEFFKPLWFLGLLPSVETLR